ncbi:TIGR04255 family protein [Pseudomonas sp.]|uniref:TIGR04255 family protein n=1 Tax=Pseudomonas sp. TaxID=306 RepID=UPI00273082D7|nr:TIGR04255 family protein [Pseudomonas sp.]MDP2242582.1 TIGR04255 family protein [Pseudomonas sp.]
MNRPSPLSNAPVYFALAQARFNPVAAIADYAGKIQDRFRRKGYTVLETEQLQGFEFNVGLPQPGQSMRANTINHWFFTKADRSCGYVLGQDFLTFQSTCYESHQDFFDDLVAGVEIVHEIVQLEAISRLGIRYLNAILPRDGETAENYLADGLHGVAVGGADRKFSASESIFETQCGDRSGTLVTKVYKAFGLVGFPADLVAKSVQLQPKFQMNEQKHHAVIDMDHYLEASFPAEREALLPALGALHDAIAVSFHAIATPHAFDVWE